jgi:hypothetical protein
VDNQEINKRGMQYTPLTKLQSQAQAGRQQEMLPFMHALVTFQEGGPSLCELRLQWPRRRENNVVPAEELASSLPVRL